MGDSFSRQGITSFLRRVFKTGSSVGYRCMQACPIDGAARRLEISPGLCLILNSSIRKSSMMINAARNNRSTAFRTLLLDALLQFVLYPIEYSRFTCHLCSTGDFSRRPVRRHRGAAVGEHNWSQWKNQRRNRPSRRNSAQSGGPLALKMRVAHRAVPCQLQVHNLPMDQRNSRRRGCPQR